MREENGHVRHFCLLVCSQCRGKVGWPGRLILAPFLPVPSAGGKVGWPGRLIHMEKKVGTWGTFGTLFFRLFCFSFLGNGCLWRTCCVGLSPLCGRLEGKALRAFREAWNLGSLIEATVISPFAFHAKPSAQELLSVTSFPSVWLLCVFISQLVLNVGREEGWYLLGPLNYRASLVSQLIKNLRAMQETLVRFLGREDPLETGKATHSSILVFPL